MTAAVDQTAAAAAYERRKDRATRRSAQQVKSARDIGELPPVADPARREAARLSLRAFCESYQSATFCLPWSPDHLKVIAKLEQAILRGGLFAVAMPRGSGKTALCEAGCLWALLFGHRQFVALIGADATASEQSLESIRIELETNETLADDFPEVCYPIEKLDRVNQRRLLYHGRSVRVRMSVDEIVLPDLPNSASASAIIRVAGITGRVRGMKAKRTDGRTVRPDLAVIDDPQTDESANSLTQCASRKRVISGAVLGLAGPGRKIAAVMPCTVIQPGDLADEFLDAKLHPQWQGERCKALYSLPDDTQWWQEVYRPVLDASHRAGRGITDATELYRANRARADKGAVVGWEHRFEDDEASAIQSAMNLYLRDEVAFFAEHQNDPRPIHKPRENEIKSEEIAARCAGFERGALPAAAQRLTAMIDVQDRVLYWCVCAWQENFTGWVVDYGTYPDQRRLHFSYADARHVLADYVRVDGVESQIYGGLDALAPSLLNREFRREDSALLTVERLLIDANYRTDTIYSWCRASRWPTIVTPSHGRYVGAGSHSFGEYKPKPGDRVGLNWRLPNVQGRRSSRYVLFDANFWKSFIADRLRVGMGGVGALALFGSNAAAHRLFAEHCTAETPDRKTSEKTGRTCDEWTMKPGRADNHWWDTLVGCAVGASMQGCALPGQAMSSVGARRKVALPGRASA